MRSMTPEAWSVAASGSRRAARAQSPGAVFRAGHPGLHQASGRARRRAGRRAHHRASGRADGEVLGGERELGGSRARTPARGRCPVIATSSCDRIVIDGVMNRDAKRVRRGLVVFLLPWCRCWSVTASWGWWARVRPRVLLPAAVPQLVGWVHQDVNPCRRLVDWLHQDCKRNPSWSVCFTRIAARPEVLDSCPPVHSLVSTPPSR
jgi:hypothetical protein